MDNLQYERIRMMSENSIRCFKPYYKWIIFNIKIEIIDIDSEILF